MKIVEQSVEILDELDGLEILQKLELCGRTAYKSEDKITEGSSTTFIKNIIKRKHESVLEHVSISVKCITDRAISHQLVRHRIASYTQESQRFCKYKDGIIVIDSGFEEDTRERNRWLLLISLAEEIYIEYLDNGVSPQKARKILPNCTKTEIIITQNLRQWRHFFNVRCAKDADPDMQVLAKMILEKFLKKIPVVFDDIEYRLRE